MTACTGAAATAAAETLEEAWQRALAHDRSVAAAAAEAEAAAAEVRAARAARWPQLEAGASYTRWADAPALEIAGPGPSFRSPPIFDDDTAVMGSAAVRLPLYTGGQTAAAVAAARHAARGAEGEQQRVASAVKLEVAQAYVALLRARRALEAAESSVASLQAHVADVQVMVEREAVARADLLAARVELADAEQSRVSAANAVALAQAAYNRWLGEPLERVPVLDDRLPVEPGLVRQPLAALVARASEQRSELASLAAQAQALAAQARGEAGRMLPQLALSGGYTHLGNEILDREEFATVGIGFSWKLFDGGSARSRAAALRARSRAAQHRLADLRSLIELEVRAAWLGVGEARARVAASREAVEQSRENLRMARELYGAGLATNTQVLDAVALQVTAANNHDHARLDELLARLRLARAVGEL